MRHIEPDPELSRLIKDARGGNDTALNDICERLRPKLLELCRRKVFGSLRTKIGESDVVQETLVSVSQSFLSFRGETGEEFAAWVARILDNKSIEFARRYFGVECRDLTREQPFAGSDSNSPGCALTDSTRSPLEKLVVAEDAARIKQLVADLPEHHRQVLEYRYQQNLTFAEIGIQMNRTEASVKNIFVRALEALQRECRDIECH